MRYCYYTYQQSATLENLLTEQLAEIDKSISRLNTIKAVMVEKQKNMATVRTLDLQGVSIAEKTEAHYLITMNTSPDLPFEKR